MLIAPRLVRILRTWHHNARGIRQYCTLRRFDNTYICIYDYHKYCLLFLDELTIVRVALSASFVKKIVCPAGRRKIDFFDIRTPGLMLEVRNSGGRTFYQRYRDQRGRERQYKIGAGDVLTIKQARRKAREVLAQALLGSDPQEERNELRMIPTLRDFVVAQYVPFAKNAKRNWRTDETLLRIHIVPALGKKHLDEISNRDIAELMRRLAQDGYSTGTTNRVLVLMRCVFNLAKKWGVPGAGENPAAGLKTAPDVCRERFLTADEAQRLLSALATDENQVAAKAIKLLLLTGARRNEVTKAKWEYIDFDRRTLLVPISKTGRSRTITLNGVALDLLRSIERKAGNPFVLPSPTTGRPCPSLHFPWLRIRKTSGLLDLRLYDLRHSFASFLVNEGVSLYVVQGLLDHTQPRMTQPIWHRRRCTMPPNWCRPRSRARTGTVRISTARCNTNGSAP
jgi:integrase